MAQNLSGISAILKNQYLGLLRDALQRIAWTWAYLKKGSLKWSGNQINWPVRMQGTNAMSWGVGGTALNASQRQVTVQSTITSKQGWCPIEFTFDAQTASRDSKGAFITAMALEMDKGIGDFVDMMERIVWGDGTGKIGEVLSYAAGVVTCRPPTITATQGSGLNGNAGVRYIKTGMILDFYTTAGVAGQLGAAVTDVDESANTFDITLGSGAVPAASDGIYLSRPDQSTPVDQEPMGVPGIIDDGTLVGTLQGISRTTYPQWAAQLISAGTFAAPGNLSGDDVQRGIDKARESGAGGQLMLWMMNDVKREFIKLGQTDVRFVPEKLIMGINESTAEDKALPKNSMRFNGFKLCWAPDVPWRTLFGWLQSLIRQYPQFDGPTWVPNEPGGGGGVLQRKTGVAGTYEAQLCWIGNVGTDVISANSSFVVRQISSTIDQVQND